MDATAERRLVLVQSDSMYDWFTIEWAEHERKYELRPFTVGDYRSMSLWYSGRVGDADIEGTAAEMHAIADAIERGESAGFKRCCAERQDDGSYLLSSPRNSMTRSRITATQAAQLVTAMRKTLPPHVSPSSPADQTAQEEQ